MSKQLSRTWFAALAMALATVLAACQSIREETTFGTTMSGIDHLADHLSVSDFWVNGAGGFQAGKGGRRAPGPVLPRRWYPGLAVRVKWHVSDWRRSGEGGKYEADVPVDPYTEAADVWVHFLANGTVRVVVSKYGPRNTNYPGPREPIPQKYPWDDYPPPIRTGPVFPPDAFQKTQSGAAGVTLKMSNAKSLLRAAAHPGTTEGVTTTAPVHMCRAEWCEVPIHIGLFLDGARNNDEDRSHAAK